MLTLLGGLLAAVGAGSLAATLTSPSHLLAGIFQAGAVALMTVGGILLASRTTMLVDARRRGDRGTLVPMLVAAAAIAGAVVLGLVR